MSWQTHEITNQFDELTDYNLFATDAALRDALQRAGATSYMARLDNYGGQLGSAQTYELAEQANRFTPELKTFDGRGRRVDQVQFHPSWHTLMAMYRQQGLISLPFKDQGVGRWSAWAAGFYLHAQVEAGTMCPATMTQACIPVLQKEPTLWASLKDQLYSDAYDARDLPLADKTSVWIGMGMTEKQGGSDVRSNTTVATPVGQGGVAPSTSCAATSGSSRRPCATPTWLSRKHRAAGHRASLCRAGGQMAARTLCRCSASRAKSATAATPAARSSSRMRTAS